MALNTPAAPPPTTTTRGILLPKLVHNNNNLLTNASACLIHEFMRLPEDQQLSALELESEQSIREMAAQPYNLAKQS